MLDRKRRAPTGWRPTDALVASLARLLRSLAERERVEAGVGGKRRRGSKK
jgi:hypothetical protein